MTPDLTRIAAEPIVWVALWVVAAGVLSAFPSRRRHWPLAYALIAAGLPIVIWAFAVQPLTGVIALVVGALVLRWPLVFLLRRLAGRGRG